MAFCGMAFHGMPKRDTAGFCRVPNSQAHFFGRVSDRQSGVLGLVAHITGRRAEHMTNMARFMIDVGLGRTGPHRNSAYQDKSADEESKAVHPLVGLCHFGGSC